MITFNNTDYTSISSNMIMNVGKRCEYEHCRTIDFLPFFCKYCKHTYCLEHRTISGHECQKYSDINHNLSVPEKINRPKYIKCQGNGCNGLVENTLLNLMIAKCQKCEKVRCPNCRINHKH